MVCRRSGAGPGAGKGRGTNCRWLEKPDSLVSCCIFEAANNHFLVVSQLLIFAILAFEDGCEVFKAI